jgi:hypothetical protein
MWMRVPTPFCFLTQMVKLQHSLFAVAMESFASSSLQLAQMFEVCIADRVRLGKRSS